jgi:hypothetical protein
VSPTNKVIITSYEVCKLSPEEIAEQEGLELESVKAVLLQSSTLYKEHLQNCKGQDKEDISDNEYEVLLDAYKSLALNTEQENVKEKALRFLINEKKGRNSASDLVKNVKVSVLHFNQQLKQARKHKEIIDMDPGPKVIYD